MTIIKPDLIELKDATKDNEDFRRVLFTGAKSQLVIMSLQEGEGIGPEIHPVDQLLYVVDGEGTAFVDGVGLPFEKGSMLCVPAGATHDIVNTGDEPLKLFTVYAPPQHASGTVHRTKMAADAAEAEEPVPA
jgi:mannose-6-phosphate isomerase-like protein (cupin superfamily)